MTSLDDRAYHEWDAIEHGQPPEHAFTHIGFFLAWLVGHRMTLESIIPSHLAAGLAEGLIRTNELAELVDGALGSFALTDEGTAFATAAYERYLDEYGLMFPDADSYGVSDEPINASRAADVIDRLHREWLDTGRPASIPRLPGSSVSEATDDDAPVDWVEVSFDTPSELQGPIEHASPELEALIETCINEPVVPGSWTAGNFGSSLLLGAIRRMERSANDVIVASGMGDAPNLPSVVVYEIAGIPAERLEAEFDLVIANRPRGGWPVRPTDGVAVRFALIDLDLPQKVAVGWFAVDGYVAFVSTASEEQSSAILTCLVERLSQQAP